MSLKSGGVGSVLLALGALIANLALGAPPPPINQGEPLFDAVGFDLRILAWDADPATGRLFVVTDGEYMVLQGRKITNRFPRRGCQPSAAVAYRSHDQALYVGCRGDARVEAIDVNTGTVKGTIETPVPIRDIAMAGARIVATGWHDWRVFELIPASGRISGRVGRIWGPFDARLAEAEGGQIVAQEALAVFVADANSVNTIDLNTGATKTFFYGNGRPSHVTDATLAPNGQALSLTWRQAVGSGVEEFTTLLRLQPNNVSKQVQRNAREGAVATDDGWSTFSLNGFGFGTPTLAYYAQSNLNATTPTVRTALPRTPGIAMEPKMMWLPKTRQVVIEADSGLFFSMLPPDVSPTPVIADSDEDGEPNLVDKCPRTPVGIPVDDSGCSRTQFCQRSLVAPIDASGWTQFGTSCRQLDWRNDEAALSQPRNCTPRQVTSTLQKPPRYIVCE